MNWKLLFKSIGVGFLAIIVAISMVTILGLLFHLGGPNIVLCILITSCLALGVFAAQEYYRKKEKEDVDM